MNKAQAEIAVAALRSGNYRQRIDDIGEYDIDHLCCIGVAAKANGCSYFNTTGAPSDFLQLSLLQRKTLVDMNDDKRFSFSEIADWIEQQEWTNEQSPSAQDS